MSVKIMGAVWDTALPREQKYVLLAYADHADHEGNGVRPSYDLIAWKTGYKLRNVMRIVAALEKIGVMEIVRQGGSKDDGTLSMPNEWRINLDVAPRQTPRKKKLQQKGRVQPNAPQGATQCTHMSVQPNAPKSLIEPSDQPLKENTIFAKAPDGTSQSETPQPEKSSFNGKNDSSHGTEPEDNPLQSSAKVSPALPDTTKCLYCNGAGVDNHGVACRFCRGQGRVNTIPDAMRDESPIHGAPPNGADTAIKRAYVDYRALGLAKLSELPKFDGFVWLSSMDVRYYHLYKAATPQEKTTNPYGVYRGRVICGARGQRYPQPLTDLSISELLIDRVPCPDCARLAAEREAKPKVSAPDALFSWHAKELTGQDPVAAWNNKRQQKYVFSLLACVVNAEKARLNLPTLSQENRERMAGEMPGFLLFYDKQCKNCSRPQRPTTYEKYISRWYAAGKPGALAKRSMTDEEWLAYTPSYQEGTPDKWSDVKWK